MHIRYCCLSSFLSIYCLVRNAPNLEVLDIEVIMLLVVVIKSFFLLVMCASF
jgi:hypothetical protein